MNKNRDNTDLIKLEHLLITHMRPAFLAISYPDESGTIQVVISCFKFEYMDIPKRIKMIFDLINSGAPEIMDSRLILIQAYDSLQMEQVLEEIF